MKTECIYLPSWLFKCCSNSKYAVPNSVRSSINLLMNASRWGPSSLQGVERLVYNAMLELTLHQNVNGNFLARTLRPRIFAEVVFIQNTDFYLHKTLKSWTTSTHPKNHEERTNS